MGQEQAGRHIGKPLDDLVVVVPGILGSRLARTDETGKRHEIWGTGLASLAKNLLTFGQRIKRLAIGPDTDPDAPGDGIVATGLISDLQLIPGFLSIAGYDGPLSRLRHDNGLPNDQVIGFGGKVTARSQGIGVVGAKNPLAVGEVPRR